MVVKGRQDEVISKNEEHAMMFVLEAKRLAAMALASEAGSDLFEVGVSLRCNNGRLVKPTKIVVRQ